MVTSSSPNDLCGREKPAHSRHRSVAAAQEKHQVRFPFTVAAPSFVIPAGASENSRFLAEYFQEVGLLFFETEACLNYTEDDLSSDLSDLPVSWHVHLPLDLPWDKGLDVAWQKISGLIDKAAFLEPRCWVLHPPTEPDMLIPLAGLFRNAGIDPARILLENVEETNLCALWPEARQGGYSTCLDLGHILAYGQHPVLELAGLWETVRMLHVYAPSGSTHQGLTHLDNTGRELLQQMLGRFRGDTLTLEVFDEKEIFQSVELLADWMSQWSDKK